MSYIYSGKVRFPRSVETLMTPLESVTQFDGNPNNGDLDSIIESIRINGFTTVITVDANTKQIVSGNHRWQALHALGATHAPMVFIDYASEEEAKRILVADNRTGQLARPDEAALVEILEELKSSDLGLEGTGYDDNSYAELLIALKPDMPVDFGGGEDHALYGIYEVTVSFESKADRDEFYEEMLGQYDEDDVRKADV